MYNIVVLCSGILYTLSKCSNSSFNLIARNAVQVMIILYSQNYNPSCILLRNKNKYLYCFFIDFKKFVKLLSLSKFIFFYFVVCGGFAPTPPVLFVTKRTKKTAFLTQISVLFYISNKT